MKENGNSRSVNGIESQERPLFVLLASVFLGPQAWEPVAEALRAAGKDAVVSPAESTMVPPATAGEAVALYVGSIPPDRECVLIAHSNAGNFVPAVVFARSVTAIVFVDSVIPGASGIQDVAPPKLIGRLEQLADPEGDLPRWTSWFDEDDVAQLFPDASTRSEIESRLPNVPLSFVRSPLVVERGWDDIPTAYIAFGSTYAAEMQKAQEQGWPVRQLAGLHLHMLDAPHQVARMIIELTQQ